MRARLIFNPASGANRRAPAFARDLREFARRHAATVELTETTGPGHATDLARDAAARGLDCAVAIGGDGTANEVAQGLVGSPCALGLVPRGSGNGLARHLGVPLHAAAALALLVSDASRVRTIDTGTANGHVFINAMGCGFDAEIARRFASSTRRGFLVYAKLSLGALTELRPQRCEIAAGGRRVTLDALLVAVANSPQYGNGAEIAPGARVDDGELDLLAVRQVNVLAGALLGTRLFLGNFDRHPAVQRLRGTEFVIRRAAAGYLHVDGEPHPAAAEVTVKIRPASLRVLVPQAT